MTEGEFATELALAEEEFEVMLCPRDDEIAEFLPAFEPVIKSTLEGLMNGQRTFAPGVYIGSTYCDDLIMIIEGSLPLVQILLSFKLFER